jgi:glycyl-tRNA synthetase
MRFHPRLAPIKAAIFALEKDEGMTRLAQQLYRELKADYNVFYDDKGNIGRRYRRQDEVGTPYCLTIDQQTLQDQSVTIRDRDSMQQERIALKEVASVIKQRLRT